jgi:hypothetical protein
MLASQLPTPAWVGMPLICCLAVCPPQLGNLHARNVKTAEQIEKQRVMAGRSASTLFDQHGLYPTLDVSQRSMVGCLLYQLLCPGKAMGYTMLPHHQQ